MIMQYKLTILLCVFQAMNGKELDYVDEND